MKFRRYILQISLAILAMVVVLLFVPTQSASALACQSPADTATICGGTGWCAAPFPSSCTGLNWVVGPASVNATSIDFDILSTNSPTGNITTLRSCLGSVANCAALPVNNTNWPIVDTTPLSTDNPVPWHGSVNGLRNSRTYNLSIQGSLSNTVAKQNFGPLTTWPGYGFTPTVSNLNCTGPCNATISWTTPFPGDSSVYYSRSAPSWVTESTPVSTIVPLRSVSALSDGTALAVGSNGRVIKRAVIAGSLTGSWSDVNGAPNTILNSVDLVDANTAWIVGYPIGGLGTASVTNNGGNTWTNVSNIPNKTLLSVYSSPQNITWAVGEDLVIVKIENNIATTVFGPQVGDNFRAVISVDGNTVIAAGISKKLYRSTNKGQTWNPVSINADVAEQFISLASLDGQVIWLGGVSGKIWKSIDAGATWSATPFQAGISEPVISIHMISNSRFWFQGGDRIGYFDESAVPQFTFDSNAASTLGTSLGAFSVVRNNRLIVVGTNLNAASYGINDLDGSKTSIGSTTVTATGLAPGTPYYYSAETNGTGAAAGVAIGALGGTFTTPQADIIPPTVSFRPVPPAITNVCPFTVGGDSADTPPGAVTLIKLTIDGNPVLPITGLNPWSASIPCSQLTNGAHTISVRSNDGTNDSLPDPADTTTVIFDNVPPTVNITTPTPAMIVTSQTITATGTAVDTGTKVVKMQYAVAPSTTGIDVSPFTASQNISWSSSITLSPGANTITFYATDEAGNIGTNSVNVTYNVPTFTVTATPATLTKNVGDVVTYTVNVNSQNNFTRPVTLTLTGSPAGSVTSFAPATVTPPANGAGPSTLTIQTAGVTTGTYTMTITGTDPVTSLTRTAQVILTLNAAPDFILSSLNPSRTGVAGYTATFTLHIAGTPTYNYPNPPGMSFTHGALPNGVTATMPSGPLPSNPSLGGSTDVDFSFATTLDVSLDTPIVITATDGTKTHQYTFYLTATPAPDFSVTANAATTAVTAGPVTQPASSNFINVTVTALNGFTSAVTMSVPAGLDPNIQVSFSPATFVPATAPGTTVTVNFHADSGVACPSPIPPALPTPCSFPIQLEGKFATLLHSAPITLMVTPDTTPPVISLPTASADYQSVSVSWQTDENADSMVVIYPDATQSGAPVASYSDFALCLSACHAHSFSPPTVTLSPSTTYYYVLTSVDGAYGGGNSTVMKSDAGGAKLQFTTTAAPDLTQPTITLDTPPDGAIIPGTTYVNASATDNNPLSAIHLVIGLAVSGTNIVDALFPCTAVTCSISYQWNTMQAAPAFANGSYRVTVWSVSSSGQVIAGGTDYSRSVDVTHVVTVENDITAPEVKCLPGQIICEPLATNLTSTGNTFSIDIVWRTDDKSTSEVYYEADTSFAADCATPQILTLPDGSTFSQPCTYSNLKRYDFTNESNANPDYTEHIVRLEGLQAASLYHYRITSCNASNLCTN